MSMMEELSGAEFAEIDGELRKALRQLRERKKRVEEILQQQREGSGADVAADSQAPSMRDESTPEIDGQGEKLQDVT